MNHLRAAWRFASNHGLWEMFLDLLTRGGFAIARPRRRHHLFPSLQELNDVAVQTHTSAQQLLLEGLRISAHRVEELKREFEYLEEELEGRAKDGRKLPYPDTYRMGNSTAFSLYAIARALQPALIVESGVANGVSSYFLLSAIANNQVGRLVSTDVHQDVGVLVTRSERAHWDLRVLRHQHLHRDFEDVLSEIDSVDLFLHDSDHRYRWLRYELDAVHERSPGASIVCDDVDASYAFVDFCRSIGCAPLTLIEPTKVAGFIVPGPSIRSRAR